MWQLARQAEKLGHRQKTCHPGRRLTAGLVHGTGVLSCPFMLVQGQFLRPADGEPPATRALSLGLSAHTCSGFWLPGLDQQGHVGRNGEGSSVLPTRHNWFQVGSHRAEGVRVWLRSAAWRGGGWGLCPQGGAAPRSPGHWLRPRCSA